jgi:hypothetical protein
LTYHVMAAVPVEKRPRINAANIQLPSRFIAVSPRSATSISAPLSTSPKADVRERRSGASTSSSRGVVDGDCCGVTFLVVFRTPPHLFSLPGVTVYNGRKGCTIRQYG